MVYNPRDWTITAPGRAVPVVPPYGSQNDGETRLMTVPAFPKVEDPRAVQSVTEPPMNILTIDIETSPMICAVWDAYNPTVSPDSIIEPKKIMCFAAKWYGNPEVEFYSTYRHGDDGMGFHLFRLLNEADVVMHYNGIRFDVPHINTHLIKNNFGPPSPYKQLDLYQTVKKRFAFDFKKLGYVNEQLELESKLDGIGLSHWLACMQGDPDSWALMQKYNEQDVVATEKLYDRVKLWIPGHPSLVAVSGEFACRLCNSTHLEKRGFAYTGVSKYQRYRCFDCGAWSRDSKAIHTAKVREVAG